MGNPKPMKKTACQPPRRVLGFVRREVRTQATMFLGAVCFMLHPRKARPVILTSRRGPSLFQRKSPGHSQAREERSNDRTQASWKSKVAGCAICPIQRNQSALERRGTLCGEDLPHRCFTETVLHLMPQGPGNRVLIRWMAPKRVKSFSMQLLPFSGQLHPLRIHQTES
jgi:hypothetical protein